MRRKIFELLGLQTMSVGRCNKVGVFSKTTLLSSLCTDLIGHNSKKYGGGGGLQPSSPLPISAEVSILIFQTRRLTEWKLVVSIDYNLDSPLFSECVGMLSRCDAAVPPQNPQLYHSI